MAIIVNEKQRVIAAGIHPAPSYSRLVGLWTGVLPVLADEGQEPTQSLGQDVRLLSIHLKLWGQDLGVQCSGWWFLGAGQKQPDNAAEVINEWDAVIPNINNITRAYRWDGEDAQFSWTLDKLYLGASRTFALWLRNGAATRWWAQAVFEISEG